MASEKTVTCPHCKHALRLKGHYHAGFSNEGFLYCGKDSTVLVFDTYNRYYTRVIPNKHPWMLSGVEKQKVERQLAPCPCGGTFAFNNKPRCPRCRREIRELADRIYYVVLQRVVNGNKKAAWN